MKVKTTYYMEEYYPVTIIEDTEEGGFTIYLPDCPGCVTCCERWEDIPAAIIDAQREWMDAVTENATPPDSEENEDFDDEISDDEEWYQGERGEALKYYMNLEYNIRFWKDSANYYNVALREIPRVSGFGASPEMAMRMLELEKRSWLFCALRDGIEIPLPQQMESKVINISFN
ncbi:type II toxin-antitoxin system HicB family antitoxin [Hominisplanchenecus sp.]|uniref:type II toxin-antitoxin system HicB family antitoxin n=1 Tax=Hominisplanchenecus sp. TaxID=3038130 RepID=UPI0039936359